MEKNIFKKGLAEFYYYNIMYQNQRGITMKKLVFAFLLSFLSAYLAFAEKSSVYTIDEAISRQGNYIIDCSPTNMSIVVVGISSQIKKLSEYVIDEFPNYLINNNKGLVIVDRQRLDVLQKEIDFQLSGEVSDDNIISLGRRIGAELVVTGSINQIGNIFRLNIKIINVETSRVIGSNGCDIKIDSRVNAFFVEKDSLEDIQINTPRQRQKIQKKQKRIGDDFTNGLYLGYIYSPVTPFGISFGYIADGFGGYLDTEFNFPYFEGYASDTPYKYDGNGKVDGFLYDYVYQGKSTTFI
jgi:TolB-like protein